MNAVYRLKYDPRHEGRIPNPGDLVAFWVEWHCPDDKKYTVQVVRVVGQGVEDTTTTTVCTTWRDVDQLAQAAGVEVLSGPLCVGY